MNWNEYLILSEKTLSDKFNCSAPAKQKVLHAAIGLCTEAGELIDVFDDLQEGRAIDVVNLKEELGDMYWYLAILSRELSISSTLPHSTVEKKDTSWHILQLVRSSGDILDLLKKSVYYGANLNEEGISTEVLNLFISLNEISKNWNLAIQDIWETNINKLKARYGEKFSEEGALNRDLDKERNVLENYPTTFEKAYLPFEYVLPDRNGLVYKLRDSNNIQNPKLKGFLKKIRTISKIRYTKGDLIIIETAIKKKETGYEGETYITVYDDQTMLENDLKVICTYLNMMIKLSGLMAHTKSTEEE